MQPSLEYLAKKTIFFPEGVEGFPGGHIVRPHDSGQIQGQDQQNAMPSRGCLEASSWLKFEVLRKVGLDFRSGFVLYCLNKNHLRLK
jgi:hypothetical protein